MENKYGIAFFSKTKNIGDDIQTYSIFKKLPRVDYVIERDSLNTFIPKENELVKVVVSGWYTHNIYSFPPSPFIDPLFISLHLTNLLKDDCPIYFTSYFMNYLKKYSPIGLRDELVKKYLNENSVDTYFSGCSTLTLEPFQNIEKQDVICLVDVSEKVKDAVSKITSDRIVEETQIIVDENYQYISFEDRMKLVEERLKFFQSCKCVITTRLHVLLPCLALGVPVLLIYDENNIDVVNRLSIYLPYINYCSEIDFINNPSLDFKNDDKYMSLANKTTETIFKFLDSKSPICVENIKLYKKYYVNQYTHILSIMEKEKSNIINDRKRIYSDFLKLEKEMDNAKKYINELENVINKK